ncbi:unnamed protein product [Cuscuta campestris]|uniref:Uncharacterized protein n=1 Tax=Cuscuta campestris TaxID=132261 RepID=A0A484NR07_9ASTE|nr:unnamed protein product [Cuscuta campestris]
MGSLTWYQSSPVVRSQQQRPDHNPRSVREEPDGEDDHRLGRAIPHGGRVEEEDSGQGKNPGGWGTVLGLDRLWRVHREGVGLSSVTGGTGLGLDHQWDRSM